jgi:sarcosine oxidase subunit gamma
MAEATRHIEAPGLRVAEVAVPVCIDVRGDPNNGAFRQAVERVADLALPIEPCSSAAGLLARALWLGPDQWLLASGTQDGAHFANSLRAALKGIPCAVTDVSAARIVYAVSGVHARDLLAKGCPLDLHERAFAPGRCAQTVLGKLSVIVHRCTSEPAFDLYVGRSYADYAWDWLQAAAAEFGGAAGGAY